MNANLIRKYIDIALFFSMCFLAGTGLLIHYRLLPGSRGGHGLTFLGLSRHEWGNYHLWAAYLLIALLVVHLVLDFAFIRNVIAAKRSWLLALLGSAGAIVVLFFLFVPIHRTEGGAHGAGRGDHGRTDQILSPDAERPAVEHGPGHERGQGRGRGKGQGKGRIEAER